MSVLLAAAAQAGTTNGAFGPVDQEYLFEARQLQALSFAVHIPLVCFGIAFPALVLFVEWLHLRTGNAVYLTLARRWSKVMLALFAVVFVWSAVHPHDYFTWILEVFPAIIGLVILLATARTFPLTPLLYTLLFLHAAILCLGGHYTYAEVPLGNWVRDALHLARNDYDRLGHFAQGFVPAILAREILLRRKIVRGRGWVYFIVVSICLAVSSGRNHTRADTRTAWGPRCMVWSDTTSRTAESAAKRERSVASCSAVAGSPSSSE